MHSELLTAKRSAAELVVAREQLTRHTQLWREAEQRATELQSCSVRAQEDAAARQAALAAQLDSAQGELAALRTAHKQLQQQLADARDAVQARGLLCARRVFVRRRVWGGATQPPVLAPPPPCTLIC